MHTLGLVLYILAAFGTFTSTIFLGLVFVGVARFRRAALEKAPKAKAAFDAFAPSHRREYLEWVAEAKQDSTRQKRIAEAIEWLGEGKRRNWKYENC